MSNSKSLAFNQTLLDIGRSNLVTMRKLVNNYSWKNDRNDKINR